jgi:hypothetical protein
MRPKAILMVLLVSFAFLFLVSGSARSQSFRPNPDYHGTEYLAQADTPTALLKPENISCNGWERNTVNIYWADKSTGEEGYKVERSYNGSPFTFIQTVYPDANGDYSGYKDYGIDESTQTYRYRVVAFLGATYGPYSDICNNRHIWDPGNFRIFYGLRGGTDDCPLIDGKEVCLADDYGGSSGNEYVDLEYANLQGAADAFFRLGFAHRADLPINGLDKIPINDTWCDGGGCAGFGWVNFSPFTLEEPFDLFYRSGDPIAYVVITHELWHFLQRQYNQMNDPNYKWVVEGQARSVQDKVCLGGDRPSALCFDDIATGYAGYVPNVNAYLANPNRPIIETSYQAALFWTYLVEKYGTSNPGDPVEQGLNLMVYFWEASESNPGLDGIATLNKALETMGYSARFKDIFKDFAVASYAKQYNGPAKYRYADMTQVGGNYNQVALRADQTLGVGDTYLDTDESVVDWGGNYYQFSPTPDVQILKIKVTQDSTATLYYKVLGIRNNAIVYEHDSESRHLDLSVTNNNYDLVTLIVVGLETPGNYRVAVNGTLPTLNIVRPTNGNKALVGNMASPDKFMLQTEVLDPDGVPMTGIALADFSFVVGEPGNETPIPADNILTAAEVMGQQWFVIRAPGGLDPDPDGTPDTYRLTVKYSGNLTDNEDDALDYTPRTNADSVIALDRSGSMSDYNKLINAGNAAKLFIDSWQDGDKFGLISFNENVTVNMNVTNWSDAPGGSRETAFGIIDGLSATGWTRIGDTIIAGYDNLKAHGSSDHDWALVLLSDGLETDPGVRTFDQAVQDIVDATSKKPVIHTVAVGPDADRPRMQAAAERTGGTYQYVSVPAKVVGSSGVTDLADLSLAMDYRYRVIATNIIGQQQFFAIAGPLDDGTPFEDTITVTVEGGAAELVLSLSWEPATGSINPASVSLLQPNGTYAPVYEQSSRHMIYRVAAPLGGDWILHMSTYAGVPLADYLVQAAIKSDVRMDTYITTPLEERVPGHTIHVVASLTDDAPIIGAIMGALVERPSGGLNFFFMYDDGKHGDGAADDGLYGGTFHQTTEDGSYNITVYAHGYSPTLGEYFNRQQVLSFHMARLDADGNEIPYRDFDGDGMPDSWESYYYPFTDPNVADGNADRDNDLLTNYVEWQRGTDPSDSDTDDDGESDATDPNPFEPNLPPVIERPNAHAFAGIGEVYIYYSFPTEPTYPISQTYQTVGLFRKNGIADTFFTYIGFQEAPLTGIYTDTNVINGQEYCYIVEGLSYGGRLSAPSAPTCAVPNSDPLPPHGAVLINDGAAFTPDPLVTLNLWASDSVDPATRDLGPEYLPPSDSASGVTHMLISNHPGFIGAAWEPYGTSKAWALEETYGLATVFVKYRDAVGNESETYAATIWVGRDPSIKTVYLPMVNK